LEKEKKLIHEIDRSTIEEILNKAINGWGEKDQYILNNISVEKYKTHIISSESFAESIIYFLSSDIHSINYFIDYFVNAIKNIKLALKDLREESDDYRFKIDYIIKKTNIKLDDQD
jgi:hypothetical protein